MVSFDCAGCDCRAVLPHVADHAAGLVTEEEIQMAVSSLILLRDRVMFFSLLHLVWDLIDAISFAVLRLQV